MSDFEDVRAFHDRFGLDALRSTVPIPLSVELARFRIGFMIEELAEYAEASGASEIGAALHELSVSARSARVCGDPDLVGAVDSLVDLTVVALGTADYHGTPWPECWSAVHSANMQKMRSAQDGSDSKRGVGFDVVKPAGWIAPDLAILLELEKRGANLGGLYDVDRATGKVSLRSRR